MQKINRINEDSLTSNCTKREEKKADLRAYNAMQKNHFNTEHFQQCEAKYLMNIVYAVNMQGYFTEVLT